jgi:predicted nucleic acid-binding protein
MLLPDVNVFVYAFRPDSQQHDRYRHWLEDLINGESAYGCSATPSPSAEALGFAEVIRDQPQCVRVTPSERHWALFRRLSEQADARGNLVPDAYFAALAIESGCEWVTTDRDYSRFPGLRWRHPLQ